MIKTVAHLADIHFRKAPTRNEEYKTVLDSLITSLKEKKPDRIVLVGDIVHDYLALGTEQVILARKYIKQMSEISKVVIIRGNHDCLKSNLKRRDSIEAIVSDLGSENIVYYNNTGFYEDENVMWCVWHHGSKTPNPWITRTGKQYLKNRPEDKIFIDLFHDPVNKSMRPSGSEFDNDALFNSSDFRGDYSFLGDIHLKQYLNKEKTIAYSGSLIAQDFSEGDDNFHGYLFWDLINKTVDEVEVKNHHHKHINVYVTEKTDFDALNFALDNKIENISLRIIWKTLPGTRNTENEQKIKSYVKNKHKNVKIYNKNDFIEDDNIDLKETTTIKNIMEQETQREVFTEYLKKLGVSEEKIDKILKLDEKVLKHIDKTDLESYEWDVVKFGATNFMSYESFDVDWRDKLGLFQIKGDNVSGKTTLVFKFIPFMLFGKTLETEKRMKFGDFRYVNNRNGADSTDGYLVLDVNGEYYGVKKGVRIVKNKNNEVSNVITSVTYHDLSSPDDPLNENNNVDSLDENRRDVVQKKITSVIGSYDNFMRIVLTTSDTLNNVLSNDMSEFLDSLLFDSGLDIFDKKLTTVKKIEKRFNEKGRVSCDIEKKNEEIKRINESINLLTDEIDELETKGLVIIQEKIDEYDDKINELNKSLHNIDNEIYTLNVDTVKTEIEFNNDSIKSKEETVEALNETNKNLPDTYDRERLEELEDKKSKHKEVEFDFKLKIRDLEQKIEKDESSISLIRREINALMSQGKELKEKIKKIKESKTCIECGQPLTANHISKNNEKIKVFYEEARKMGDEIRKKENEIEKYENDIEIKKKDIESNENKIELLNNEMEEFLGEIGILVNKKNDVQKRGENETKIKELTFEKENLILKNSILENKIKEYEKSLTKIEENKKINIRVDEIKKERNEYNIKKQNIQELIHKKKIDVNNWENKISEITQLIETYKIQVERDEIFTYYKKCVHREGVPKQMLVTHIIPRINKVMNELLSETLFSVWLDNETLKPKLLYNDKPDAVVDCISSSGKERTFSSVVLKFALNQINIKSKPKIFMMDEIMGKLDDKAVEEFVLVLQNIKKHMNRLIIVEHSYNVLPDYIIEVELNENRLSEAVLI